MSFLIGCARFRLPNRSNNQINILEIGGRMERQSMLDWKKLPEKKKRAIFGIDGRTTVGRRMRRIEKEIVAALGREPSESDRFFVKRAVSLKLRLDIAEAEFGKSPTKAQWREYIRLNETLDRQLRLLGFRPTTVPVKNVPKA
ncbi:MAG: hypothetical protein NW223_23610 [Hyphomicrobiaceae bacterium]|nr:hypothetical protein [Hyphomicrobiaceae bacterium]